MRAVSVVFLCASVGVAHADKPALIGVPAHAKPAPWLEPPAARELVHPLGEPRTLADGYHRGLGASEDGKQVFFVGDSVEGPLDLPKGWRWVGLVSALDQLIVAEADGTLAVADLESGKLVPLFHLPGATSWDAAGSTIILSDGRTVAVSRDGGRSFERSRAAAPVKSVFAREDGVVVTLGKTAQISTDGGVSWLPARYPIGQLERRGGEIWNENDACPATLASDGVTWIADGPRERSVPRAQILQPQGTPFTYEANTPWSSPGSPSVPAADAFPKADEHCVHDGMGEGEGSGGMGLSGRRACNGARCLAGTIDRVPRETRTEAGFVADRAHHVAVVDRGGGSSGPPRRGAEPPDRPAITIRDVPDGCLPKSVESIGGLVLLECDEGQVYTTTRQELRWHDEGKLSVRHADTLATTMAPDGSILRHAKCKGRPSCVAVARDPLAPNPRAWREVAVPGAIVYRVAEKGVVLAVGPDEALTLTADDASGRHVLVEHVALPEHVYGITVDADGHVVVSADKKSYWIDEAGKLVPGVPEPRVERTPEGYEISDAVPIEF